LGAACSRTGRATWTAGRRRVRIAPTGIELQGRAGPRCAVPGRTENLAAALLLTQADLLAGRDEKPVILLDDLASEFDEEHSVRVLERKRAPVRNRSG
jgi:recombinational DNA repair ATPase RecF